MKSSCCSDVCRASHAAVSQCASENLCRSWSGCLFLPKLDRWCPTDSALFSWMFQPVPLLSRRVSAARPSLHLFISLVGSASWHHFLFSSSLSSSASFYYSQVSLHIRQWALSACVCVCIKCMHLLELLYEGFLLLYSHLVQVALVWWMPMWCSGSVLVLTGMRLCVCGFVPKQFILQKLIHNDSSVHCLSFEDLCEMCLVLDKNKVFHIYLKKSKSLRLKIIILTTFGQQ